MTVGVAWLWGFALQGIDAVPVRVEAHVRPGLPGMTVVGLPGAAVKEARERVRSAAGSSGMPLPAQRMTVNLSPGDLRKEGPGLDLPVALAVLAAAGHLPAGALDGVAAHGEVALDGLIRPVRGVLAVAEAAGAMGLRTLLLPIAALPEAAEVGGTDVVGLRSLGEAVAAVRDPLARGRLLCRGSHWLSRRRTARRSAVAPGEPDFRDVAGHRYVKRALELAAAGGHHVLMVGSPGSGKTMLARRVPSILPPLERQEALEVTRVWSVAGLRSPDAGLVRSRPFRAPHHTASRAALVGGGPLPRPGEVSLAHRGVLFLDEFPEFSRDSLEALRQPLEEGVVSVSRRGGAFSFPAACTLVAAMNPCPCGSLGHPVLVCRCTTESQARYRNVLNGPLADRIDLRVEVPPLVSSVLEGDSEGESSAAVQARVLSARRFRAAREAAWHSTDGHPMERPTMHPATLERRCRVSPGARRLLRDALERECLGGRGYVRVLAVARTLADLDQRDGVESEHIAEALAFRVGVDQARGG